MKDLNLEEQNMYGHKLRDPQFYVNEAANWFFHSSKRDQLRKAGLCQHAISAIILKHNNYYLMDFLFNGPCQWSAIISALSGLVKTGQGSGLFYYNESYIHLTMLEDDRILLQFGNEGKSSIRKSDILPANELMDLLIAGAKEHVSDFIAYGIYPPASMDEVTALLRVD
ncbi:hypothetical protein [Paenibacillus sp. L3-i20]|uniref:hypothetical protein n=1 Tax=Paenibacillus sp. L3-i20 TaxID=2905833 RepID=UPI0020BF59E7|nr:hypothetical protein [Paenibacillus sp. L3-i20]